MPPTTNQKPDLKQACLILLAVIAWLAVLLQIALAVRTVTAAGKSSLVGVINTLSYFTILTNLLVAIVSTASALRSPGSETVDTPDILLTRTSTMSAVAVYIFIVGLTYSLLLRSIWDPTGLSLVLDIALHDITPIVYVLFWFFFVPKGTLRWSDPISWLIYPVVYIFYCLVRGAITGLYPYYFVDVTLLGYAKALLNTALMLIGFWVIGLIVVAIDRSVARFRLNRTASHAASV